MPSFNVTPTSTDRLRFRQFIDELRRMLRASDEHSPFVMQEAARLPPQVDNPTTMDLTLRRDHNGDTFSVTLRLRTDNLYVIGFHNSGGQWYEFLHNNGRARMIPGSTDLPFNGSYASGLRPLSQEEDILGSTAVGQAIIDLANYNGGNDAAIRTGLRRLIVNFIESIRFNPICDRVDSLMRNNDVDREATRSGDGRTIYLNRRLTAHEIGMIRHWADLSTALRIAANDTDGSQGLVAENFGPFRDLISSTGIINAFQAAIMLGMVLITIHPIEHHRRNRRSVSLSGQNMDHDIGLTLVEVIGVLIKNIDGENPGDLYGTVSLTNSFGTVNLFHRDRDHTQSVGPDGWADIAWPSRAISGADDFSIDVNLMDRDKLPDPSPDDEVAREQIFWNSHDALAREWDTVQRKVVTGQNGSVEALYVVLTDAVVAAVEVIMVKGDGEAVPDVYGSITATTKTAAGESLEYKLFEKRRGQDIGVPKDKAIPLKRKLISAALCSELRVDANLWDADRFPDLSPDDQIAKGSVALRPCVCGHDSADITGDHGRVRVNITWSVSFE